MDVSTPQLKDRSGVTGMPRSKSEQTNIKHPTSNVPWCLLTFSLTSSVAGFCFCFCLCFYFCFFSISSLSLFLSFPCHAPKFYSRLPPPPTPSPPDHRSSKSSSMSEFKDRAQSPSTGPIVGGILAALIVIFASVIIFRLARRRWKRTRSKHDPERPLGSAEDKHPSAEGAPVERSSLAHTVADHTDDKTRGPDHPDPPPVSKQEEPQRLVSPLTATISSPTTSTVSLQAEKPMTSAASDSDTQSISATTFLTAVQSVRYSASNP